MDEKEKISKKVTEPESKLIETEPKIVEEVKSRVSRVKKQIEGLYTIEGEALRRRNPFCPRCGEGIFLSDHGEWWSCGKCGDRYNKKAHGEKFSGLKT